MRRRTLDLIVSSGALALAALLAVVGFVLVNDAGFSREYVAEQLSQEKIAFPEQAELSEQDRAFTEAGTGCLITFAGQEIRTGKQAECYANEYIGSHLTYLATRLGMPQIAYTDGLTYRELGGVQGELREKIATAEASNDPELADLQQELTDVTTLRTKMLEGSMLRNALLTTYGFSILGDRAGQAANGAFIAAGLLALLAIAGYVHAWRTPRSRAFAPVEPEEVRRPVAPERKELVGV